MGKTCPRCRKEKDLSEYAVCRRDYGGLQSRCKECNRKTREATRVSIRAYQLKYKFGISQEDYDLMYSEQEGRCQICKKPREEQSRALAVDHCHHTGKVRGLLCTNCNSGIGKLGDDPDRVRSALKYLEKYG